jgi:ankyrin repeat protein
MLTMVDACETILSCQNSNSIQEDKLGETTDKVLPNNTNGIRAKDYARNPLHAAVIAGRYDAVVELIAQGTEVNRTNELGRAALHYAFRKGETAIAAVLLDHGADPNLQDRSGNTPMHLFAMYDAAIKDELVAAGANVNVRNQMGWTPLHYASIAGDIDYAEFLIEHGAKVDAVTDDGSTALHIASAWGKTELCKLLLVAGIKVNDKDKSGSTALQLAVSGGRSSIEVLLRENGAQDDLYTAIASHKTALVTQMLATSPHLVKERYKPWSETALHLACRNGCAEIVTLLLEAGSDVNDQDKRGLTPLHQATMGGHMRTAKLLLKHGAQSEIKDGAGKTALKYAKENLNEPLVNLLNKPNHPRENEEER